MTQPTIVLCTLVLNEGEWLEKLYRQHKDWPGMTNWIFIESADKVYAQTTPEMVSKDGLSVDRTSKILEELSNTDPRVIYIPMGFSTNRNIAQGKCQARNRYLEEIEKRSINPEWIACIDADEFYTYKGQEEVNWHLSKNSYPSGIGFGFRHPWRPPTINQELLFNYEVVGGFWAVPHTRFWRFSKGMRYRKDHNTPEIDGYRLDRTLFRYAKPECIHMAFSSSLKSREAKHKYYEARGEGKTDFRQWYVDSRKAWSVWQENDILPKGATVIPYTGPIPEVFREEQLGSN